MTIIFWCIGPLFNNIGLITICRLHWQFCKSVPLLDITQTLRWKVPFIYPDAGTGSLVLLYKLAVILPIIGTFFAYWKEQTD